MRFVSVTEKDLFVVTFQREDFTSGSPVVTTRSRAPPALYPAQTQTCCSACVAVVRLKLLRCATELACPPSALAASLLISFFSRSLSAPPCL